MNDLEFIKHIAVLAGSLRRETFCECARLAIQHGLKRIVETGCYRGIPADGQSTIIFTLLAERIGGALDSVDINNNHLTAAKQHVPIKEGPLLAYHASNSIPYLAARTKPIDLLYLDSYDFDPDNPEPAQRHQMAEVFASEHILAPKSVVLLDDAALPHGGKAKLAAQWLATWKFNLVMDKYQLLFARGL